MQDFHKGSILSNKFNHYHVLLVTQWGVFPIEVGEDVERVEIDTEETDKKLASYEKLIEEFEQAYDLKYSHLPKWFRDGLYEASFYEVKREFGEGGNPQMFHRAFVVKIEANYTQLIGSLCS